MGKNKRPNNAAIARQFAMPNQARERTMTTETMYQRVLTELSLNRFKWVGLPDSIDERFMELTLFRNALCVFYREESANRYLAVQGTGVGNVNMYNNPTEFQVIGNSMVNKRLGAKQCVPIWANFLRIPDHDIVYLYATKLAEVDRTIEINLKSMRQSQIMFVDENQRLSYVNLMRQHQEGQPLILGTPGMDLSKIQVFNLGIDKDQVVNLMDVKARLWNEAMTLLGINNSNQDKKERLVADEVSANNDQVSAQRSVALKSRKIAAEQINRMYSLTISVDWDETAKTSADAMGFIHAGVGQ